MKKIIILGMSALLAILLANETPKEMSKQKVEKTGLEQKQVNVKVQEKKFLKQEAKNKRQNYPRGNIATH